MLVAVADVCGLKNQRISITYHTKCSTFFSYQSGFFLLNLSSVMSFNQSFRNGE